MIITRFPPSPTGAWHIGGARTSFYNWLFARQNGGKFIFRIEDTDVERSTKLSEKEIIDNMHRLGMEYDAGPDKMDENGPYRQMERLDIYNKYIQQLLDEGKAYYAWETPEELEKMRDEAYKNKKAFVYREIKYTPEQLEQFKKEGRKPVVRFKVENKKITWQDAVKGELTLDGGIIGDFVIMKSDGVPTYYIANVVDDNLMGITHIIRGEEHVNNTPKQILLYEAYGWELPIFGHLPLMLNTDKSKMSKRDTGNQYVSLKRFREEGFLKEALINFIILLGWHPSNDKEFYTVEELLKEFSLERVSPSNAVYDFKRALWFNSEYIKNLSDEDFANRLIEYLGEYGDADWKNIIDITEHSYWFKLTPFIKVRLQTLGQFKDFAKYFFIRQFPTNEVLYNQKMGVDEIIVGTVLKEIKPILSSITDWTIENIQGTLLKYISEKGFKNGQVLWPLRAILTGVQASPGTFEMLYILGKTESVERLKSFEETCFVK